MSHRNGQHRNTCKAEEKQSNILSVTGREIDRHEMLYRGFNGFCSVLLFGDLL